MQDDNLKNYLHLAFEVFGKVFSSTFNIDTEKDHFFV